MPAKLIDGSALAAEARQSVAERVVALKAQGKPVHLTAILVGSSPAAKVYAQNQKPPPRWASIINF
jgi:5,10-methylene-tetrahydrofolate dehydrogenase/methenyl tetrahydrofolate cyclohydrolase